MEGIREVANGGSPVSPEIARRIIVLFQKVNAPEHGATDLTPHETRILKLLVDGHNYKTAAVEPEYGVIPYAAHLRKAPGAFQIRGCRQGAAEQSSSLKAPFVHHSSARLPREFPTSE
jgi:hypothetical protein